MPFDKITHLNTSDYLAEKHQNMQKIIENNEIFFTLMSVML